MVHAVVVAISAVGKHWPPDTALGRRAIEAINAGEQTILRAADSQGPVTAVHVALAAAAQDPLALRLMQKEGEFIGIGLVNVLHLFSPQIIALGGGVMKNADLLFPPMRKVIAEMAMEPYQDAQIELATLGDRTGVLGAAALDPCPHQSGINPATTSL